MKAAQRQSSFELLRILSMAMVLVVHLDGASLGLPEPNGEIVAMSARDWWCLVVESLSIIGVNCFTLISGYFGIRISWRGLLKFSASCLFYSLGIYLGLVVTGLLPWQWTDFADAVMIFSHTDLWYVPAYLGLYLISPILNAGVENLEKGRFQWCLMAFVAFNLYCGWWWGAQFNATGYTVVQLIMMYLIGRYIGRYGMFFPAWNKHYYLLAFLLCSGAITLQAVFCNAAWTYAYNSPLVVLSSVAFFQWVGSMRFESRVVNTLAASSFAVYLLHKNPYIWGNIIKPASIYMWQEFSLPTFTVFVLLAVVVIYLFTTLIDRVRIFLLSKW